MQLTEREKGNKAGEGVEWMEWIRVDASGNRRYPGCIVFSYISSEPES